LCSGTESVMAWQRLCSGTDGVTAVVLRHGWCHQTLALLFTHLVPRRVPVHPYHGLVWRYLMRFRLESCLFQLLCIFFSFVGIFVYAQQFLAVFSLPGFMTFSWLGYLLCSQSLHCFMLVLIIQSMLRSLSCACKAHRSFSPRFHMVS
jgi:hypothetical protein